MIDKGFNPGTQTYNRRSVLVIAEIGTGHGGDIEKGRELIDAAIDAGADCVKFQHVYADEIIHPATGLVPLPGGPTRLYDRFRSLETSHEFLGLMKQAVEARGALFLCTPFGLRSARELRDLGVSAMKVASPELNYVQLLDEIASYHLPTVLSSGVSTLADIEYAVSRFAIDPDRLAVLHCVTAYPAPETDYNVRILGSLSALLGVAVGISDHSMDPILVPALSVASGASIVEKHICLSRHDDGLDDPVALEPQDFARMTRAIRTAEIGEPVETIRALADDYGLERVESTLGDGRKRLAESERANYDRTNRSIHARRPIASGEPLSESNLAILRTEKVLRPGLQPRLLPVILGRRAVRDVPDGQGLEWADVGGPMGE
jgi:sialic acid synthase SpsE